MTYTYTGIERCEVSANDSEKPVRSRFVNATVSASQHMSETNEVHSRGKQSQESKDVRQVTAYSQQAFSPVVVAPVMEREEEDEEPWLLKGCQNKPLLRRKNCTCFKVPMSIHRLGTNLQVALDEDLLVYMYLVRRTSNFQFVCLSKKQQLIMMSSQFCTHSQATP